MRKITTLLLTGLALALFAPDAEACRWRKRQQPTCVPAYYAAPAQQVVYPAAYSVPDSPTPWCPNGRCPAAVRPAGG